MQSQVQHAHPWLNVDVLIWEMGISMTNRIAQEGLHPQSW
jgi:hypothetical protein